MLNIILLIYYSVNFYLITNYSNFNGIPCDVFKIYNQTRMLFIISIYDNSTSLRKYENMLGRIFWYVKY